MTKTPAMLAATLATTPSGGFTKDASAARAYFKL